MEVCCALFLTGESVYLARLVFVYQKTEKDTSSVSLVVLCQVLEGFSQQGRG